MEKRIDIAFEENQNVQNLFNEYNAYLSILKFFGDKAFEENSVFDRKWAEAVQLNIELEKAKHEIERKYKPEGNWMNFYFDFDKQQVVFTNDEAFIQ